jgi:hypothetical protein
MSVIGSLKSEDAMTIGRVVSVIDSEERLFEFVLEFVQAEIVGVKQVMTRAIFITHFKL